MPQPALIDRLFALADRADQKALLRAHMAQVDEPLILALKARADQDLRADLQAALADTDLLYTAAALTGNPLHRALALFAEANICAIGGLGDYERAIACCDEAATIYAHAHLPVDQADAQVTKIFALAMLGRYDTALAAGIWAATILEEYQEWLRLATVMMNVAIVYGRMGQDQEALCHFDRAGELYAEAGVEGSWSLPGVAMNRALVLRNLGRFNESLAANREAIALLEELGQVAEVGHAQQTMAFTYYTLGHYNEALLLLDRAEARFAHDGRHSDLLLTALYRGHCLLEMQRFAAVITQSDELSALAHRLNQPFEEGYALLNKARALAGLQQDNQALDLLTAARAIFATDGNRVWEAEAELAAAHLLLKMARFDAAAQRAIFCAQQFAAHQLPLHTTRARLLEAEAYCVLGQFTAAGRLLLSLQSFVTEQQLPTLGYRVAYLLGQVAEQEGKAATALGYYDHAISMIEQLRGRLMVEHRAEYLTDKERVYGAAVHLALAQGQPAVAHAYADRARSQALHDLLTLRIDLHIRARHVADEPLVTELNHLRQERDHHYRRQLHAADFATLITPPVAGAAAASSVLLAEEATIPNLEERIAALWHTLLVRNADYTQGQWDDGSWSHSTATAPLRPHPYLATVQAHLAKETALLSYYLSDGKLTLFVLAQRTVTAQTLPVNATQLQRLIDVLRLNLGMAAGADPARLPTLVPHAQKILHQLYQQLLAPVQQQLACYSTLIIVPHGPLHYIPFHALVTQFNATAPGHSRYIVDEFTVSYLPSAAFLTTGQNNAGAGGPWIAFGHSYGGQLPHTLSEVEAIGQQSHTQLFLEAAATKAQLQTVAPQAQLLHLATHGDFRADNPLFSGLALDDGWLSTLDIFNLRIRASLVTLSACQTGRSTIHAGDELLGLMRAFLAAGASSLVLSLWAVHDASTAELMLHFYAALRNGESKAAALRHAQHTLRTTTSADGAFQPYAHPYFWAPFLLIGDAGAL